MAPTLLATVLSLQAEARESHLAWMIYTQLPALSTRPGVTFAALYREVDHSPSVQEAEAYRRAGISPDHGQKLQEYRYLSLLGAASPDVFFSAAWDDEERAVSTFWERYVVQRSSSTVCVLMDEATVNGQSLGTHVSGGLPAPVIQLGQFQARSDADDFELARLYRQSRFPAVALTPGCISLRKMVSVAGSPKHAVFYEFETTEARESHFGQLVEFGTGYGPDNVPAHRRMRRYPTELFTFAPGSPLVARRIWPV